MILSNHQTDFDAVILPASFNRPVYMVGTDTLLSNGAISKFLVHAFGAIPKKKGEADLRCVMQMIRIAREGGSIGMFPEGNRTYAEFQYEIGRALIPLIRKIGIPVCIYNIEGGTGCLPRFGRKARKGLFRGFVREIITKEMYSQMSDSEFYEKIKSSIRVYDSESNREYQSKSTAEYLERMLFVCPKCKKTGALVSSGNDITCTSCHTSLTYTNALHFTQNDLGIESLNDWYQMQKKWTREYEVPGKDTIIFDDPDVTLYSYEYLKKRTLLAKGSLKLYSDKFVFGENYEIPIYSLKAASSISGIKFNFTVDDTDYLVVGTERFNPLKYVLMLHKLDTEMKRKNTDMYYSIED